MHIKRLLCATNVSFSENQSICTPARCLRKRSACTASLFSACWLHPPSRLRSQFSMSAQSHTRRFPAQPRCHLLQQPPQQVPSPPPHDLSGFTPLNASAPAPPTPKNRYVAT